jgi:DNA-binding IclR family transcriptional regulator
MEATPTRSYGPDDASSTQHRKGAGTTMTSSTAQPSAPVSMIDRVVEILDSFDSPGGLTLAQVVARTGLPRSSTHRILESLVRIKWLHREEHTYHLGIRVLELGTLAAHQHELRSAAMPHLHELQSATGLVVHLALLDGTDIVYLDKLGGRFSMRVPSRVGGRAPAHCTGAGKAMLAFADETVIEELLRGPVVAPTSVSISSATRLRAELTRVRERGIAFDREEAVAGIGCVAAPISTYGAPTAAVSVCGPISRMNLERLVSVVRAAAHKISYSVGYSRMDGARDYAGGWPTGARPPRPRPPVAAAVR